MHINQTRNLPCPAPSPSVQTPPRPGPRYLPEPEPPSPRVPGVNRLEIHLTARARGPGAGAGAAAALRQRSQCGLAGLGSAREPVWTRRRPRAPSPGWAEPKGTPRAALGGEGTGGKREGGAVWGAVRYIYIFLLSPLPRPPSFFSPPPLFSLLLLLGFF